MVSELISCGSGTLIVMVAWRRSCVAFLRHRCRIAGTEFFSDTRPCQFGIRTHLVWDCMGIYECCLKLFLSVLVAWTFRQDSPLFTVLLRIRKNMVAMLLGEASPTAVAVNSRPREKIIVLYCVCV